MIEIQTAARLADDIGQFVSFLCLHQIILEVILHHNCIISNERELIDIHFLIKLSTSPASYVRSTIS